VFFARAERPVRYALVARYGFEMGREATAEAFAYAWEHWDRVGRMENPDGYTYRVGQRLARRWAGRKTAGFGAPPDHAEVVVEPKLRPALERLSPRQRVTVVLVSGLGWTHREAADFQGISTSSVQKHLERALNRLRTEIGVDLET